jgi:hypothetical protein
MLTGSKGLGELVTPFAVQQTDVHFRRQRQGIRFSITSTKVRALRAKVSKSMLPPKINLNVMAVCRKL